jgi:hypothetical protein
VDCPEHSVKSAAVPRQDPHRRFSMLTNGVAEGINSKIMSIKRRAGGYRNIENFKKAIFFYCGGLDLYPR